MTLQSLPGSATDWINCLSNWYPSLKVCYYSSFVRPGISDCSIYPKLKKTLNGKKWNKFCFPFYSNSVRCRLTHSGGGAQWFNVRAYLHPTRFRYCPRRLARTKLAFIIFFKKTFKLRVDNRNGFCRKSYSTITIKKNMNKLRAEYTS